VTGRLIVREARPRGAARFGGAVHVRGAARLLGALTLLLIASLAAATARPARAEAERPAPATGPRVHAELISEHAGLHPGGGLWVGLRQRIAPGWHTYWINPGDSGEATTIAWALPPGVQAGEIMWPHPERIPSGPVMSYGYSGEVTLLSRLTLPAGLSPGTAVTLKARAAWLVCEQICIPEEADVSLTLPVLSGPPAPDPRWADIIAAARRAIPVPSPWPARAATDEAAVTLTVAAPGLVPAQIADVWFYPSRWGVIDQAGRQDVAVDDRGITIRVARGPHPDAARSPVEGVLVVKERLGRGLASQAFAVRAESSAPAAGWSALAAAVGLALLGGLLLNAMPCVLPVLSVKVLSLVRHAEGDAGAVRRHGAAYTAGILVSFAILAGALVALRAAGEEVGWGFQLQSPLVVAALAYVFFALGLSLSGVLVIGGRAAGLGQRLAARPGYTGSFFTGALATVAATPCTAPFMGVATGFALTQPAGPALLVFEALGLGLALPYLVLAFLPSWRRFVPRPGPWMERVKQLLAFPLYASVAWLVWVMSQQAGSTGVAVVSAGLVLIGFAAWLREATRGARRPWRGAAVGIAVALVVAAIALPPVADLGASRAERAPEAAAWEPFSARRLGELRARGTPVFVNFTAAWCVTCLVNERVALHSPEVARAFADKGVVYLKGDWTNRNPEIARTLQAFGRSGVPLYLLYPRGSAAGAAPTVLPEILTEGTLIRAVNAL
jgi:thiol:disulfide interchange protein DsbD